MVAVHFSRRDRRPEQCTDTIFPAIVALGRGRESEIEPGQVNL